MLEDLILNMEMGFLFVVLVILSIAILTVIFVIAVLAITFFQLTKRAASLIRRSSG